MTCLTFKKLYLVNMTDEQLRSVYARARKVALEKKYQGHDNEWFNKMTVARAAKYLEYDLTVFGARKLGAANRLSVYAACCAIGQATNRAIRFGEEWTQIMAECLGVEKSWVEAQQRKWERMGQ